MAGHIIQTHRQNAEIYTGADLCAQKSKQLLSSMSLPVSLLPLNDVVEVGYNPASGFVWLTQKQPTQHRFEKISKTVWYDKEVTAYLEPRRLKRLTGVKSKEVFIWVGVNEICVEDEGNGNVRFVTATGISRSYPIATFVEEEKEGGN